MDRPEADFERPVKSVNDIRKNPFISLFIYL
jgi:hypothetical protein